MKLTADSRQLTAKSQHLEDMKEANPGGSPKKQKAPTKRLGRRRRTGLGLRQSRDALFYVTYRSTLMPPLSNKILINRKCFECREITRNEEEGKTPLL